jgi:hypothetical protein
LDMRKIIIIILVACSLSSQGQTTLLLEATGTQFGLAGATATWSTTAGSIATGANPTGFKNSSTIASTTIAVNTTVGATTLFGQFVSPQLKAQTISGTVTGYARASIANTSGATCSTAVKITVINSAGTILATLLTMTNGSGSLTTTLTSYTLANAATLTSYDCADGDRICIEVGIIRTFGTTARDGTLSFGSSSATNITAAAQTAANNPVMTFSNNIAFNKGLWSYKSPNEQSICLNQ